MFAHSEQFISFQCRHLKQIRWIAASEHLFLSTDYKEFREAAHMWMAIPEQPG